MKKYYNLGFTFMILAGTVTSYGQDKVAFDTGFTPIKAELVKWDPVRGDWLAGTIKANAEGSVIPDRTFPENLTPHEMYKMVPSDTRDRITAMTERNSINDQREWQRVKKFVNSTSCGTITGRTYGDPHLVSFDGARYSFQTVGEFVLAKNSTGTMEVQTRQKALGDDFSLNTAVAMNVSGDRVCFYSEDYPDGDRSTPIRLNGRAVFIGAKPFFLPNGGTIQQNGNKYIVHWPTGESVSASFSRNGTMDFINVGVHILDCSSGEYNGLLGNANGREQDDFDIGIGKSRTASIFVFDGAFEDTSEEVEKERQIYLSKEFAKVHRINQATSLFDYGIGESTLSFTDPSFPRYYRSLRSIDVAQRDRLRKNCESSGVSARDINGCIYDQAYVEIPPTPAPVVTDRTKGLVLARVERPEPNVNPDPGTVNIPKPMKEGNITNTGSSPTAEPILKPNSGEIIPDKIKDVEINTSPIEKEEKIVTPKPKVSIPKPSTPRPSTSTPKPSAPKPSAPAPSTPKPSTPSVKTGTGSGIKKGGL